MGTLCRYTGSYVIVREKVSSYRCRWTRGQTPDTILLEEVLASFLQHFQGHTGALRADSEATLDSLGACMCSWHSV